MIALTITIVTLVVLANAGLMFLLNIINKQYTCTIEEIDNGEFTETQNIDII